jgi:hypothetical protein
MTEKPAKDNEEQIKKEYI